MNSCFCEVKRSLDEDFNLSLFPMAITVTPRTIHRKKHKYPGVRCGWALNLALQRLFWVHAYLVPSYNIEIIKTFLLASALVNLNSLAASPVDGT